MAKIPLTMEHALLGLLARRPMHAYEMYQTLKDNHALGLVWRLKQSHLYALLARLEDAGYIVAVTEHQGTRPPRKILHLTPSGQDAFNSWLRTPVAHGREFRQEFLAKLYFAQTDGLDTLAVLAERQRRTCQDWLTDLEMSAASTAPHSYDWLVLHFRTRQVQAILDWLDSCVAPLANPVPA